MPNITSPNGCRLRSIKEPSRSSSAPALVGAPTPRPHSSEWLPTTWPETTSATAYACPGKWFPRSPKFGKHTPHIPTDLAPATPCPSCTSGSPLATGVVPDRPDTPPRKRIPTWIDSRPTGIASVFGSVELVPRSACGTRPNGVGPGMALSLPLQNPQIRFGLGLASS
jgi:hypothetical protein